MYISGGGSTWTGLDIWDRWRLFRFVKDLLRNPDVRIKTSTSRSKKGYLIRQDRNEVQRNLPQVKNTW